MIFSLIVATLHRTDELSRFLASIGGQKLNSLRLDEVEVILVDQNEDERLAGLAEFYGKAFCVRRIKTPNLGLSNARNVGMKVMSGSYVSFPDDDCFYDSETLEGVFAFFKKIDGHFGVFARGLDPADRKPVLHYPLRERLITSPRDLNVFTGIAWAQFYSSEAARTIGGFDMSFGIGSKWGSGEETDFAIRFLKAGGKIQYRPEIVVYHPLVVPETMPIEKVRRYSVGFGALCRKQGLGRHLICKVFKQAAGCIYYAMKGDWKRSAVCLNVAVFRLRGYLQFKP
jgi:GT2 family glycosyltransferase